MILCSQKHEITRWDPGMDLIEICSAGQLCYKSSSVETFDDMERYVRRLRDKGHHSPLEHSILSVVLTTNRGVSHELVRHRLASFNQESTRYCNYSKDRFQNSVTFIQDTSVEPNELDAWLDDCRECEERYFARLRAGKTPDKARGVLNNDVKTEVKVTANYREWRHIFNLRCDDAHAHYQMVELLKPLLEEVRTELPCVFDDIEY